MAGTREGGLRAARTNRAKHGDDFYKRIGGIGGHNGHTGGFASEDVGVDGLTGPERARLAGSRGGRASKPRSYSPRISKLDGNLFATVWNAANSSESVARSYKVTHATIVKYAEHFRSYGYELRELPRHR